MAAVANSIPGHVLHILIGYVDHPMGIQLLVYALTIGLLGSAVFLLNQQQSRQQQNRATA